jgi:hypothetical protein
MHTPTFVYVLRAFNVGISSSIIIILEYGQPAMHHNYVYIAILIIMHTPKKCKRFVVQLQILVHASAVP